jgi:hypothetical protein
MIDAIHPPIRLALRVRAPDAQRTLGIHHRGTENTEGTEKSEEEEEEKKVILFFVFSVSSVFSGPLWLIRASRLTRSASGRRRSALP